MTQENLPQFIQALLDPAVYPHPADNIRLVQTHISYVLLAGDYVYKFKKPVNFGFLDFFTLEKRNFCCEQELLLNRRLCPEIYLDLVTVTREGDVYHHFSRDFSSTIKLEEILAKMVSEIRQIVPYERCAVYLLGPQGRRLVLRDQFGFLDGPAGDPEVSVGLDEDLFAAYLASNPRPHLYTKLRDRGHGVEIVPGAPGQERINSLLSVPLRRGRELVGLLVLTADEPGRFDAEDLELLGVVADQAAVLISNALLHQQVKLTSVTDGLTGLYNHRHFQERLQLELERIDRTKERVSLLLLDIDHFKKINDTHGHTSFRLRSQARGHYSG